MAYIRPCKTCSYDCSDEAKTCPNCGQPWPTQDRQTWWGILVALTRALFVIVVFGAVIAFVLYAFGDAISQYLDITAGQK